MKPEVFDILIVGAGVSGIGTACTLIQKCPDKTFAILERRQRLGGTWDLFRFPGVRSDSDMHSYAYSFRPWRSFRILGEGASIRQYLTDTAREFRIDRHISYGIRILEANWSSAEHAWTLRAERDADGGEQVFRCRFLVMGTGYFDQDAGHNPAIDGLERFDGPVIHPQHWPENMNCAGKRVLVIGSGATAVTLVPALAGQGARVTMLQRSPGFLLSLPSRDVVSQMLSRFLPRKWVFGFARLANVAMGDWIYRASRRWPGLVRKLMLSLVRVQLKGAADARDFEPRYQPWDERLCVVSDGDLFAAVRAGQANVVTDEIAGFATGRVLLKSGRSVETDIVVTATGLKLQAFGGIRVTVDGNAYRPGDHMSYKGVLLENLPNLAWMFGYINHAWTLKTDLSAAYVCRLLKHMDAHGKTMVVACDREACRQDESIMSALSAGYVRRSGREIPRQGSKAPWFVSHDRRVDRRQLIDTPIDDDCLVFYGRQECGDGNAASGYGEREGGGSH